MGRILNIACLQTRPRAKLGSALDEALVLAEEAVAAGGQLIALPEYCGGLEIDGSKLMPPARSEDNHPVLIGLKKFAKEKKVWMVIGSLANFFNPIRTGWLSSDRAGGISLDPSISKPPQYSGNAINCPPAATASSAKTSASSRADPSFARGRV
jgi:hypothetical protein